MQKIVEIPKKFFCKYFFPLKYILSINIITNKKDIVNQYLFYSIYILVFSIIQIIYIYLVIVV